MKGLAITFREIDEVLLELINLISSFTDEEINTVPFEGSWTPGEVAQHIIITLGGYMEQLEGPVTDTGRAFDEKVPLLKDMFLNFDVKYESPVSALPEIKHYDKREILHKLEALKHHINHYDRATDMTLSCVAFEFPGGLGSLTRTENLHFLLYHTKRHLHQLKNIHKAINHIKINHYEIY
jgi:hypothetical protein